MVINGRLIRTNVVQYESLAFVIAHQLGVLFGSSPKGEDGFTCKGQADYAARGDLPLCLVRLLLVADAAAIEQTRALFEFIDPKNRAGAEPLQPDLHRLPPERDGIGGELHAAAGVRGRPAATLDRCRGRQPPPAATRSPSASTTSSTWKPRRELGNYGFNR